MKRLLKRVSSFDTPDKFLMEWCTDPNSVKYSSPESIEKIVSENHDCVYSGIAYRFIELLGVEYENKNNDELLKEAKNAIRTIEQYSSFSLSKRGVEYFVKTDYREFGVIIQSNVTGIDIKKLTNKYREDVSPMVFQYTDAEDEIVSFDNVDSYDIVAFVIDDKINWIE